MIYVTGDTHGEQNKILYIERCGIGEGDYLIVCGDFGFILKDDLTERNFLNDLERRPYTICFCDGNHENFPVISSFPEEIWNGGKIHRIRKNIVHLMRGQTYCIQGKSIFVMGGAYSIDKQLRKEGVDWWSEELPTNDEYKEASKNLKGDNVFDAVITHTAPSEIVRLMGYNADNPDAELCGFLEWIMYEKSYKVWFFGHFHRDVELYKGLRAIYNDVVPLN